MFPKRLKELRQYLRLSQYDLAKILNTNRSNIANYEQGVSEPNIEMLIKIAVYFNVTVDYLIGASPYKTFNEQAEFVKPDYENTPFSFLNPELQRNVLLAMDNLVNTIAFSKSMQNTISEAGGKTNISTDHIMFLQKIIDMINAYNCELLYLNRKIFYAYKNKSLSDDAREFEIRYDIYLPKIRKLSNHITELLSDFLNKLLKEVVFEFHTRQKEVK